ncbi:retrotransposon hot spot (RHS) protein [Trypanosoma cruzi]|nr:retrotransposon hot spot (RHS) protein [Trypanosoma cruzi]
MDVWVDNTLLQGAANKGSSKSHAMTWELQRICLLTLAEYMHPLPTCGLRKTPQTAYHAAVFLRFSTWRRGGTCEGQRRGLLAAGPQSLPLHKKLYMYPIRVSGPQLWPMDDVYIHTFTWCKV